MRPGAIPSKRKRLLVVTRFSPLNGSSGAGTYLFSILDDLRGRGLEIVVCWSERPSVATRRGWYRVPRDFDRAARLVFPESVALGRLRIFPNIWWLPFKARALNIVKKALFALGLEALFRKVRPAGERNRDETAHPPGGASGFPAWNRPLEPEERAFFTREIARFRPGAILFNFCWMTPLAGDLNPAADCLKITLTHDLRHLYSTLADSRIVHTEDDWISKEDERRMLAATDSIAAIREDDGEAFARLLPGKRVLVAPPSFRPAPGAGAPEAHRCLFAAGEAEANREGIAWFVERAWPLIRAAIPGAELHLCGTVCRIFSTGAPGVVPRGFVDDLDAEYAQAAVVIVPLLRGSGVKIKLLEALAHGKACVTTPIGSEGLPVLESCVLQAASPEEFASQTLHLLTEPDTRRRLEERALRVIGEHFSPAACYGPLYEHIIRP